MDKSNILEIKNLSIHFTSMNKKEARERAIEMLDKVGISNPEKGLINIPLNCQAVCASEQ